MACISVTGSCSSIRGGVWLALFLLESKSQGNQERSLGGTCWLIHCALHCLQKTLHVFRSTWVSQEGCHSCQLCRSNAVGMGRYCHILLPLSSLLTAMLIQIKSHVSKIGLLKNLQGQLPEKPRHLENVTHDNYLGEQRSIPFKGHTSSHSLLSHKQPGLGPLGLDRRHPPIRSNLCPTLLPTLASVG